MIRIIAQEFGSEVLAARMRQEVRAFQREQRVQVRIAANMVKADVIHEVQSRFSSRGARKRSSGKVLGPLDRSIGVRILNTSRDVVALIRPRAKAFYGRFLETGLNVMRKGRITKASRGRGRRNQSRGASHRFVLPRIPFLEPVADRDADKVAEIIGDSYGVFYRGGP
jgi:hypothetical protein